MIIANQLCSLNMHYTKQAGNLKNKNNNSISFLTSKKIQIKLKYITANKALAYLKSLHIL